MLFEKNKFAKTRQEFWVEFYAKHLFYNFTLFLYLLVIFTFFNPTTIKSIIFKYAYICSRDWHFWHVVTLLLRLLEFEFLFLISLFFIQFIGVVASLVVHSLLIIILICSDFHQYCKGYCYARYIFFQQTVFIFSQSHPNNEYVPYH